MKCFTWIVVIFVIQQDLLLDDNLFVRITHVNHTKGVVGYGDLLEWDEGGQFSLPYLSSEDSSRDSNTEVVLDLVVEQVDHLGRGDDVDAVVGALGDVDTGHQRGSHHTLNCWRSFIVENTSANYLKDINVSFRL